MILADITITSGSPTVTLNSSENISGYREGDLIFVAGQNPLTILSISSPSITLKNNAPFSAVNTSAEIIASNVYLRGALDTIQKNNETWGLHFSPFLNWISTSDLQADLIDSNGSQVTVYSAQGLNQLAADIVAADLQLDTLEPRVEQMENELSSIESTLDAKVAATDANVIITNDDVTKTNADVISSAANAAAAAASFDNFDDKYLGPHSSDPTVDNDGDQLVAGQTYWNTTAPGLRYYTGVIWDAPDAAAQASADSAATSELNAAASAVLSNDYANYPEDQLIPGTSDFSAFHWMKKASALAGGTAPDSFRLGGELPGYYATAQSVIDLEKVSNQPTNISPSNLSVDVMLNPTLSGSSYSGNDFHIYRQYRISTDAGMASIIYDSWITDDFVSHSVPEGILTGNTKYWFDIRDFGLVSFSTFSSPTSFTTEDKLSDSFAITLHTGNAETQEIINGLNSNIAEDSFVWVRARTVSGINNLFSKSLGVGQLLQSNSTAVPISDMNSLSSFNDDGFSIGNRTSVNQLSQGFVSWEWIKKPGFFDTFIINGDGTNRSVPHDLNSPVALLMIKNITSDAPWQLWHSELSGTQALNLNSTDAAFTTTVWNGTTPTATEFTITDNFLVNQLGQDYLVSIFANNPNNGIASGYYNGTGAIGNKQTTSFRVGWLLIKLISSNDDFYIFDIRRNPSGKLSHFISPNNTVVEGDFLSTINSLPDGFDFDGANFNGGGTTYIYLAIADPLQF